MVQFNNSFVSLKSVKGKPFLYMVTAWSVRTVAAHVKSNSTWLLGSPDMPIWICNFRICQFEDCYIPLFLSFSVPLLLLPLSPNFHQCHNPARCRIPRVTLCSLSAPAPCKHTPPSTNTHTLLPTNLPTTTVLTLEVFLLPPQSPDLLNRVCHLHLLQVYSLGMCISIPLCGPKSPATESSHWKERTSLLVSTPSRFLSLSLPPSLLEIWIFIPLSFSIFSVNPAPEIIPAHSLHPTAPCSRTLAPHQLMPYLHRCDMPTYVHLCIVSLTTNRWMSAHSIPTPC